MSGVKRYDPEGYTQPASRSGTGTHMVECKDGDYVLASDYDALSQRCRELEQCMSDPLNKLVGSATPCALEVERYRGVRRGAAAHGYTEEQFDEQTDRQLARLNDAMRNEQ